MDSFNHPGRPPWLLARTSTHTSATTRTQARLSPTGSTTFQIGSRHPATAKSRPTAMWRHYGFHWSRTRPFRATDAIRKPNLNRSSCALNGRASFGTHAGLSSVSCVRAISGSTHRVPSAILICWTHSVSTSRRCGVWRRRRLINMHELHACFSRRHCHQADSWPIYRP